MTKIIENLFFILLIGCVWAQERSISGASSRRNRFPAGKAQVINFNCPEDFGYYAHPTDCSQYYVCVFGGALLESCTGGLMYSTELQTCDWPRNVVCKSSSAGVSTIKITDPRTRSTDRNSIHSATESHSSSSILSRGIDNTIRNPQPLKSSGLSKAIFEDSSQGRQGRFLTTQEDPQRIDSGFQAQETSSRAFNVVPSAAATPNSKLTFPPSLPGQGNTNRFSSVRSSTKAPSVDNFYGDILNLNDTDYYYYYDDLLYDDYNDPSQKTTTKAPVVRSPNRPPATRHQPHTEIPERESTDIPNFTTKNLTAIATTTFSPLFRNASHTSEPNTTSTSFPNSSNKEFVENTEEQKNSSSSITDQIPKRKEIPEENEEENEILKVKRLALTKPIINNNNNNFNTNNKNHNNNLKDNTNLEHLRKKSFPFATITVSLMRNRGRSISRNPISINPRLIRLSNENNPLMSNNQLTISGGRPTNNINKITNTTNSFPLTRKSSRNLNQNTPNPSRILSQIFKSPSRNLNSNIQNLSRNLNSKLQTPSRNVNPNSQSPSSFRQRTSNPTSPNRQTNIFENRRTSLVTKRINPLINHQPIENKKNNSNEDLRRVHIVKKVSLIPTPFKTKNESRDETKLKSDSSSSVVSILGKSTFEKSSSRVVSPPKPVRILLRENPPFVSNTRPNSNVQNHQIVSSTLRETQPTLLETNRKEESKLNEEKKVLPSIPRVKILATKMNTTNDEAKKQENTVPKISLRFSNVQNIKNTRLATTSNDNSNKINISENLVSEVKERGGIKQNESKEKKPINKAKPVTSLKISPRGQSNTEKLSQPNQKISEKSSTNNSKPPSATITFAHLRSANNSHKLNSKIQPNKFNASSNSSDEGNKNKPRLPLLPTSLLQSSHKKTSKSKIPESLDETSSKSSSNTGLDRGSSRNKPKPSKPSSSSPGGKPQVVGRTPQRPPPLYPQPQVDVTAAPCDRSICRLPDCYCGGKDIPGNITPQNVPQMVLLTFDDSVNDLNKKLYIDLFEKGRVNPNGCPISATFYISHEWTDYSQVQNLYSDGHEIASHSITHSFGEQFSTTKWAKEIGGQREIMSAYGGVRMEDIRGMRAPFLAVGGNNMFRMLYDLNFTYDSSMPVYENNPPSWPYTLDYKIFHDCMIPPCPTNSFPGVWQVPMVMWQDLAGGRCSMGDACTTPPDAEGVYKMLIKNFERHYTTNRSPFGLFYHAAWFTTPHHKEGFIAFLDTISAMDDVWLVTNWQALQWVRDPLPLNQVKSFPPFQCDYPERPPRCTTPKVCNVWHKGSVRYMKTCQSCPESYPWTGKTGVPSPLNDI